MKRLLIATALICSTALSAHADQMVYRWYDTIRHNGHKRPDAIGNANTAKCDAEYGQAFFGTSTGLQGVHGTARLSADLCPTGPRAQVNRHL
jgi:hypothetical protein